MYEKVNASNSPPDVVEHVESLRKAGILSCDALSHNNETGCENPACFKYNAEALKSRIKFRFDQICLAPLMWAGTREALVAQISLLIDLSGGDGRKLYRLFPRDGNAVLTLGDALDETFAERVVAKAKNLWSRR